MSLFPSVDTSLLPEFDSDVADVLEDDIDLSVDTVVLEDIRFFVTASLQYKINKRNYIHIWFVTYFVVVPHF